MTQQEKEEIRQIIREELAARGTWNGVALAPMIGCAHYWVMDNSGTVTLWRCSKCGTQVSGVSPFGAMNTLGPGQ